MDFTNIDLINGNMLQIKNEDGTFTYVPEEGCSEEHKEMINNFRSTFPKGKEWYKIVDGVVTELTKEEYEELHPIIKPPKTELEITQYRLEEARSQIVELSVNLSKLMDYVSTIGQ